MTSHEQLPITRDLGEMAPRLAPLPQTIGAYRVLSEIGHGGMGVVYLAERRDGQFEQRVALKVLPAWAERGDHGRFLRERQFLARMEHKNISRLLDGGITEDGAPYFAMEFVAGEPLTVYAKREHLDLRARIGLFLKICDAVHYAHQHLIVHRDLKPNNVLVDAEGEPKLLDFGIAKAVDDGNQESNTQTVTQLMTPAYAAPEQILGKPVSTLTDVYALGVILHELLLGERPHPAREGMLLEAQIVQDTVPLPSSRRSAVASINARELRGDLDLILLSALKRDPTRRYASVEAMAKDLKAFLDGRPITARADSWTYRLQKLIARNRAASVAAAVGVSALLLALVMSLSLAERARMEAARAAAVKEFLLEMFDSSDPNRSGASNVTARELLDSAAMRVTARWGSDAETQREVRLSIATAYNRLGLFAPALKLLGESGGNADAELQRAIALRGLDRLAPAQAAAQRASSGLGLTALAAQRELASLSLAAGDFAAAEKRLLTTLPKVNDASLKVGMQIDLARIYSATERLPEAQRSARAALIEATQQLGAVNTTTAAAQTELATILDASGEREAAGAAYVQALATLTQLLGESHLRVLSARDAYGFFLLRSGDSAGAQRELRAALASAERAYGPQHASVGALKTSLSTLYARLGNLPGAETLAREALTIHRAVYGPNALETLETLNILATILGNAERFEEANVLFAESLRVANTLAPEVRERKLSSIEHKAANLLRRQNRCGEARALFVNVIARESRPDSNFNLEPTYARLAECELALNDPVSALQNAQRAYDISRSPRGLLANQSASLVAYARALAANGQEDESRSIARQALASAKQQFGVESPAYREALAAGQ